MTASMRRGDAPRALVTSPLDGLLAGLRLALFPAAAGTEADVAVLSRVAEWHAVAALAERHRVAGVLLRGLRTRPHLLAATGIEPTLRARRDRAVRRGWRQLGALKRATDRLAASAVPCLVLKGLPLSQRIHGHPLVRDALDIDLLVAPRTYGAAAQALLAGGWKLASGFRETPARNRWHGRVAADRTFIGRGAKVELHPRVCHNPHYFAEGFEDLRARSVVVHIGTAGFRTLGEDDEFLYLACHGTRHGWLRLDWLCDVAALLARMPRGRLERIAARSRETRLDVVLACTLRLCNAAFHVALPAPLAGMREEHAAGIPAPAGGKRAAFIAAAASRTWCHRNSPASWRQLPLKLALKLLLKPDLRYVRHEMAAILIDPRDWARIDQDGCHLAGRNKLSASLELATMRGSSDGTTCAMRGGDERRPFAARGRGNSGGKRAAFIAAAASRTWCHRNSPHRWQPIAAETRRSSCCSNRICVTSGTRWQPS